MASGRTIYGEMTLLAWRNVRRNWRHSLATILAIASGFMAVSLFDGFIDELEDRAIDGYSHRAMIGQAIFEKQGYQDSSNEDQWRYTLTAADQRFLEDFLTKDPNVLRRVRFLTITGMVTTGTSNAVFIGYGYDPIEGAAVRGPRWAWNAVAGKPLDLAPKVNQIPGALLGAGLGRLLECESTYQGPPFILDDGNYLAAERPFACKSPRLTLSVTTESAQVNSIDVAVSGIIDSGFREADKRTVHIALTDAQRLFDTDKISLMTVELKDQSPAAINAFINRAQQALATHGGGLEVVHWHEHRLTAVARDGLNLLYVFRNLFMAIVVTIGVMSVANTMMKAVNERIREIGTLRSLGFFRRHLMWMFAAEGFFLSLIACAIGLALTLVLTFLIGKLGIKYRAGVLSLPILLRINLSPMAWMISGIVLSVLATGTAWFCARRATRMVIADAMRHV